MDAVAATNATPPPRLGPEDHVPVPGTITFAEFLQGLNPLQHLPVVGTLFREATGTRPPPAMLVLGGAVLGGPVGMLSAAVVAALGELRSAQGSTTRDTA